MSENPILFEQEILTLLNQKLEQHKNDFFEAGLEFNPPHITRDKRNTRDYESEVAVNVVDDKGIFDVLEFHIYYNGIPKASKNEIDKWIENTLTDIIRRRVKGS